MSRWDDFVETLRDKYPLMYLQAMRNKELIETDKAKNGKNTGKPPRRR
jgi:hypothetical protein